MASKATRVLIVALLATIAARNSLASAALEDPTRPTALFEAPAVRKPQSAPQWVLESTLIAHERRLAVINGRRVSEGDQINGARVVKVSPGLAELEIDGRRFQIAVRRPQVKQPSP